MTPEDYCQQKAAQSGSSFYYSFLFLPPQRRQAITALYAFCREVDDVVDETSDASIAQTTLQWWRHEVKQMLAGSPNHPVTKALQPHLQTFNLRGEHLLAVIDGMEMDVKFNRYESFEQLELYCYRVASCVGILSAHIFGYKNKNTLTFAKNLGIALQLTNIIRDLGEDARRGRIYIPLDELKKLSVSEEEIISLKNSGKIIGK